MRTEIDPCPPEDDDCRPSIDGPERQIGSRRRNHRSGEGRRDHQWSQPQHGTPDPFTPTLEGLRLDGGTVVSEARTVKTASATGAALGHGSDIAMPWNTR